MSTKKILIGVLGSVLVFGLFIFLSGSEDVSDQPDTTTAFPETKDAPTRVPATSKTIEISASNNLQFQVSNFVENGETAADPVNDGQYVLAGSLGYCLPDGTCPSGLDSDSFSVSYSEEESFFTLVILKEPIAESRKEAELFLMSRLGIGEKEMCQLHYSFSAPYWVNEFFAGRELGFSFCPGSVSLE